MRIIAYTDGSYSERGGKKAYASAAIFRPENGTQWMCLKHADNKQELISFRNVAGELLAVTTLCDHIMRTMPECTELILNYDYVGIENWVTGIWKANNVLTANYRDYMREVVMPRLSIVFNHTKGHSGDTGNEKVDKIARNLVLDYLNGSD